MRNAAPQLNLDIGYNIHIHLGLIDYTGKTLTNLMKIMVTHEDKMLKISILMKID